MQEIGLIDHAWINGQLANAESGADWVSDLDTGDRSCTLKPATGGWIMSEQLQAKGRNRGRFEVFFQNGRIVGTFGETL